MPKVPCLLYAFTHESTLLRPKLDRIITLLQLEQTVTLISGMTDLKYWFPMGGPHFFMMTSILCRDSNTSRPHTTGTNSSEFCVNESILHVQTSYVFKQE